MGSMFSSHGGHSADVRISLMFSGHSIPVAQLGPDFLLLDAPADHPPGPASILLRVDQSERRWDGRPGQEPGYTLEVSNAVGDTLDVVTVRESQIERLTAVELLPVHPLVAGTLEAETPLHRRTEPAAGHVR